jgi:hypothetical protein
MTALHYIQKGLLPTIEPEIKVIFTNLLEALITHYVSNAYRVWDDYVVIQLLNLFVDNIYIFNDANFLKLQCHIQHFCENTSFQVQAAYFKVWQQFLRDKESQ